VELEQQTYADGNIVHEPGTDRPERIAGLQALLDGAPLLPERKLLWHCAIERLLIWKVLEKVRLQWWMVETVTEFNSRTGGTSGRARKPERSDASHGHVHCQGRE